MLPNGTFFRFMARLVFTFFSGGKNGQQPQGNNTLAASIFVGVGIGYLLDHKVFKGKTAPWLTLIFLGFGIAAGFKNLYMLTKRKDL
jgi:hypothetical protein